MLRRMWFITVSLAAGLVAQEGVAPPGAPTVAPPVAPPVAAPVSPTVAPTIPQLAKDGDAFYLKGDYEAARLAFTRAWELAEQTPRDNPVRYDILKRLTSVRAAAGEFADADN